VIEVILNTLIKTQIPTDFFARDCSEVAKALLGKVIRVNYRMTILSVQIIETEAYYVNEKASHASLGYTKKRRALFMPPGTIYMYYSRAGDSLNVSCLGDGNAVLIKSGIVYQDRYSGHDAIAIMQQLNPPRNGIGHREVKKLCSGQTLLCRSLGLTVPAWDARQFNKNFFISDVDYVPDKISCTPRLGIPCGRDEHLLLRFVDHSHYQYATPSRWKIK